MLAAPDPVSTAAWVAEKTGITPSAGGRHLGRGTRNMLCSFGPRSYLEIIGADPDQPDPDDARPFGIDELTQARLVAWAIAVPDIDASRSTSIAKGYDPGPAEAMQRERPDGAVLGWRLTPPRATTLPFLIEWADSTHPARDASPGLELVELRARHPEPSQLANTMTALGLSMEIEIGPEALLAEIHGPLGTLQLS